MSKYLITVDLGGGCDAFNAISARDSASVAAIQAARALASANVLDYTAALTKTGNVTAQSDTITNVSNLTGVSAGMSVYSASIPAQRKLKVGALGTNSVTLVDKDGNPQKAFATAAGETITFASATQLLKLNESNATGRDPAFHYNLKFIRDIFNVPDISGNASKVKGAVVCNIGPIRRKTYKSSANAGIYSLKVDALGNGTLADAAPNQIPTQLTSHNDQTTTWHSNGPEGAVKGWGGGIADKIYAATAGNNNQLVSVSASGRPAFTAGDTAKTFNITARGLIRKFPDCNGNFTDEANVTLQDQLRNLFIQATVANAATNDFTESFVPVNQQANDFQSVLGQVHNLTDPPSVFYNNDGSEPFSGNAWIANMKNIARLILANAPNRGASLSRTAGSNIATITTQVTTGVANRVAGSNIVTVTSAGHGLFSSGGSASDLSDSILVTPATGSIDSASPASGYKITLVAGNEDNAFSFQTADNTVLTNVSVNIQHKHNLTLKNKVFLTASGIDSSAPVNGYQVVSAPSSTVFTINTTATTVQSAVATKFKLINVDKEVIYTGSPGISWDSHTYANHSNLGCLNDVLAWFNDMVSRIQDADVVTFTLSEFGRTFTSNSTGTDHAWGGHQFIMGKSVRGNKVYGTLPSYSATGPDLAGNILVPSTSVYQYGATFARWMGLSDAEVLALFPDLQYWPAGERYLGFLDALV